jgi:hypothetical protein
MTDLDELSRLLEQATPGPWEAAHRKCVDAMYRTEVYSEQHGVIATVHWTPKECGNGVTETYRQANAALIAALRNAAEELVRDARRYRWLRENGEEAIGRDRGMGPEWTYGDELDALVDAAIAQEQP